MSKKKLIETHAKVETFQPTLMEQVWGGTNELSRYGTLEEVDYAHQINEMTRADLEAHARRLGVFVVEDTIRLRAKLLADFRAYASALRKPNSQLAHVKMDSSAKAAALKVMSEGR